jgi:hypothetical protein
MLKAMNLAATAAQVTVQQTGPAKPPTFQGRGKQ